MKQLRRRMFLSTMATPFNEITGANAGGLRLLPIRTHWAARIAQFRRWAATARSIGATCL